MMKTYAHIENGDVVEVILPMVDGDGVEIPASERFTPAFMQHLVDITSVMPTPAPGWRYDGESFSNPAVLTLGQAQAAQITSVTSACQAAIVAGFSSAALGSAHTYPAQVIDQQNLSASVLSSMMPNLPPDWTTPFWCEDAGGNWAYVSHTAAQIQQVGQDGKAAIIAAVQKKAALVAQINAATTVATVQTINWS